MVPPHSQRYYISHALVSYFVFSLKRSAHLQNNQGIGAMASVQKASRLVAHPAPNPRYICKPNNGKTADNVYRVNIAAPAAEAPYSGPKKSIMKRLHEA